MLRPFRFDRCRTSIARRPPRPSRALLVVAILLTPALATGCGSSTGSAKPAATASLATRETAPAAAVLTDTIAPIDTAFTDAGPPTVSGTLEARTRAVLRAELSGPVRLLSARVGERVSKGMVLAQLEVPAVAVSLAAARAQVAAQESQHLLITRERERTVKLVAVGGASRAELEELEWRLHASDAAITAARAQLAHAATDQVRATIRAPFAGVVERRSVTQGSVVQAGDELLTIVDPRVLELEGGVAITHVLHAREGARVALRISGWGDSLFQGRIVRVAPAVDPVTRQLRVTVELPNTGARVPVGAWAEGSLLAAEAAPERRAAKRGIVPTARGR